MAMADASDNVYVRDLPVGMQEEAVQAFMATYGGIVSMKVFSYPECTAACARYSSVAEATVAVQSLNGATPQGCLKPLMAKFASTPKGKGGGKAWDKGGKDGGKGWNGGLGWAAASDPYTAALAGAMAGAVDPFGSWNPEPMSEKIYIKDMPGGLDQTAMQTFMEQFGIVTMVHMLSRPDEAGTSGLVKFANMDEARRAVSALNGQVSGDKIIQARFARAQGKGGKGEWGDIFSGWGKGDRWDPYGDNGKGKGKDQGPTPVAPGYRMIDIVDQICKANMLPGGDGSDRSMVTELHISNLPADCSDVDLYKVICAFGQIRGSGLQVVPHGDGVYGVIDFLSVEAAQLAMQTLNGKSLPGGKVLQVEARQASIRAQAAAQAVPGQQEQYALMNASQAASAGAVSQ